MNRFYLRAKPYLKGTALEANWTVRPRDRESILAEMLNYMPFAWGKANDERGISAWRSMAHYSDWIWFIGDDFGDLTDYDDYGKPNLRRICIHYGWDYSQWEDPSE